MMTSESPRNMKRVCLDKVQKSFSNLGYISHQDKNIHLKPICFHNKITVSFSWYRKKNTFFEFVNYVTDKLYGLTDNIVDNFTILTQLSNKLTSILIFIWMKIIKILSITMYRDEIKKKLYKGGDITWCWSHRYIMNQFLVFKGVFG